MPHSAARSSMSVTRRTSIGFSKNSEGDFFQEVPLIVLFLLNNNLLKRLLTAADDDTVREISNGEGGLDIGDLRVSNGDTALLNDTACLRLGGNQLGLDQQRQKIRLAVSKISGRQLDRRDVGGVRTRAEQRLGSSLCLVASSSP